MTRRVLWPFRAVLAASLVLSFLATHALANTTNPRVGPWQHRVSKCMNGSTMAAIAHDCRILDGGTWTGSNTRSDPLRCENPAHPMPWANEALIEPRVAAREGRPAVFTGWMTPGETATCDGGFGTRGVRFTRGIESSNVGIVEVGEPSRTNYGATRNRTVACPDGYRWNEDTCALPDETVTLHKNNDECPASPNGSNPVHSATGRKLQRETDYRGQGPFPLEFTRFYSSGKRGYFNDTHIRSAGLGSNWRHTYAREIVLVDLDGSRTATAVRPNGNEYFFEEQAPGEWIGDADVADRLEARYGAGGRIEGWRYVTRNDEREAYDSHGRLVRITNRQGLSKILEYDLAPAEGGDGLSTTLDRVTDPFGGRSLHFSYGGDGKIERITVMPQGDVYRFEYYGRLLVRAYYPDDNDLPSNPESYDDNPYREYRYNESGHVNRATAPAALTGIIDENGVRYASWWYSGDRVIRSQLAPDDLEDVNRIEFQYNDNNTTTITDALGTSRVYDFHVQHGVARIGSISGEPCEQCGNPAQSVSYDANGYRHTVTDFNGHVTEYEHDERGREVQRIEARGTSAARSIRTHWHPTLRVPTRIEVFSGEGAAGMPLLQTSMTYAEGRPVTRTETDPATGESRTWHYTYHASGLLASVTGPRSDVSDITTYTYDGQGNLTAVTNPLGQVTRFTAHNGHGQPLSVTDPNGVITTLEYDARQRLIRRTEGDRTTHFTYDPVGNLIRATHPDGSHLTHHYDAARRVVGVTDNLGNRIRFTLDAAGNRLSEEVIDPQGNLALLRRQSFDSLSRLHARLNADSEATRFSHDATGNLLAQVDPLQRRTEHAYDALNRLVEILDPAGGRTEYGYDARDRITQVVDPRGVTTTYRYNAFGDLLEEASPDAGVRTYTVDQAGNRIAETDARGITRTFSHDALNRPTGIRYPDPAEDVRFIYDQGHYGIGRLSAIEDASGRIEYEYNAYGELLAETRQVDDLRFETRYEYDPHGRLAAIHYPSGATIQVSRDSGGRVAGMNLYHGNTDVRLADEISHAAFGAVTGLRLGNGLRVERDFDLDGRVDAVRAGSVLDLDLAHDAANNITALTDLLDATRSQAFDYDRLDRLVSALGAYGYRDYSYDPVGNRLTRESDTLTEDYTYADDSNRLTGVSGGALPRPFVYDANGNTVDDGHFTYTYNQANRLGRVHRSGSEVARYAHNALGQRTRKTLPGSGSGSGQRADAEQHLAFHRAEAERLGNLATQSADAAAEAQAEALLLDGQANVLRQLVREGRRAVTDLIALADSFESHLASLGSQIARLESNRVPNPANWQQYLTNLALDAAIAGLHALAEEAREGLAQARAELTALEAEAEQALADAESREQQAGAHREEAQSLRNQAETAAQQATHHLSQADHWAQRLAELEDDPISPTGQDTHFVYDVEGRLIGEYGPDGTPIREYIHLHGIPLAMLYQGEVYYFHTDHLGTPRRMTDSSQVVVWDAIQSPFGALTLLTEEIENPLRFPGQYFDQETGLHYNHFRTYDPATGRYLESDPLGLVAGPNTYLYVGANPLYWIDPTGLAAECIFTSLSFRYSASGEQRTTITRRWDNTVCGPVNELSAPMPPNNPRKPGRGRPWDLINPKWKCQTTYFRAGHTEELHKAMAWGVLRCYDDCGQLTDETYGYKRWESADDWRKIEGSDFEDHYRGPIFP